MVTVRSGGRLPHWEEKRATYFVTFRLADALPASVLESFELRRENILAATDLGGADVSQYKRDKLRELFDGLIERHLDAGSGSCYLARPKIAEVVAATLKHYNGQRYTILAWCLMPNHVHVVFTAHSGSTLAEILHSWKSFSASRANRLLGRTGPFWQREYYDHLVRDDRDLERVVQYVLDNPAKAGLVDWRWVGRS